MDFGANKTLKFHYGLIINLHTHIIIATYMHLYNEQNRVLTYFHILFNKLHNDYINFALIVNSFKSFS